MKEHLLLLCLIFSTTLAFSQTVHVDTTIYLSTNYADIFPDTNAPIYPTLPPIASSIYGNDSIDLTFHVNTANILVDTTGIFLAGGTGFGFPGDNPLSDPDGDGVWSITLKKPKGFSSHYIFLNGNCTSWDCEETLNGLPCADPNNWEERWLPPVFTDTTLSTCYGTCATDTTCPPTIAVTFAVNTENIVVDSQGIYLAGGAIFGAPENHPMTDADGDGIWEITVALQAGQSFNYIYTNGNCPNFSCKEDLIGQPCADQDNFDDRFFAGAYSDTTVMACFNNCTADGTCPMLPDTVYITFSVNMQSVTTDIDGVFIGGDFENWAGSTAMTDDNNDDIWYVTLPLLSNQQYEYQFINGMEWELFDPMDNPADTLCTITVGDFVNRSLITGVSDSSLTTHCFNSCTMCAPVHTINLDNNVALFSLQPNLAARHTNLIFVDHAIHEAKTIRILNPLGQTTHTEIVTDSNTHTINVSQLPVGMYFVHVQMGNRMATKRLVISR